MNASQYFELVIQLRDKTEAGKLEWSEYQQGTPMTTIGDTRVLLQQRNAQGSMGDFDYYVLLYSGNTLVDSFSDVDLRNVTDKGYSIMGELYKDALGRARGIDKVYTSVLQSLKSL